MTFYQFFVPQIDDVTVIFQIHGWILTLRFLKALLTMWGNSLDIINIMTKKPFINAVLAAAYIFLVVTAMNVVTQPLRNKPDTFMAPVTVLFVLTLSVAVMAYLFFYQPLLMFIDGKKEEAVNLFIKTVGIFAVLTAIVLGLLFSGLI